jgi:predicted NAD/FAD-dependent oxidoreductase
MDVLIVGAGLAGLTAAQQLRQQGRSTQVVDKGRQVGGRLATRRVGLGLADVGAQFFTSRTAEFRNVVGDWVGRGLAYTWSSGWADSTGEARADGYPRYAARGGMGQLARELARDLAVQHGAKISALSPVQDGWQVMDAEGRIYACRAIVLTAPVPQSLVILETGRTPMKAADLAALRLIRYEPCLAGLFSLDGEPNLPEPGAIQHLSQRVRWVADNQRKGISTTAAVTVLADAAYSRAAYSRPETEILADLLDDVRPWLGAATVNEAQLRRWRYAEPAVLHSERCLVAEGVPPLVFAGDAFAEARVEGAVLSGMAAAEALAKILR